MFLETATHPPDYSFADGELRIRGDQWQVCLRGWPNLQARLSRASEMWQDFRPEFRLLRPPGAMPDCGTGESVPEPTVRKVAAFRQFREALPGDVVAAVEHFTSHQWNGLELIGVDRAAIDLAAANPALFFCLANNDQFRRLLAPDPAQAALAQLSRRQRDICEWLGFPGTQSMVRLLGKILPEAVSPHDLRSLRQAVKSEAEVSKMLAHLPAINAGVLGLACNLKLHSALSTRLLYRVVEAEEERTSSRTADLLVDSLYLLHAPGIRVAVPRFESIEAVREFHDRAVAEWQRVTAARRPRNRARRGKSSEKPFPPPPVPGTDTIIPLTSEQALRREGSVQGNCVASYASRVRGGGVYIYRILTPERATLSIIPGADGCWRRNELELSNNRKLVKLETRMKVDRWLYDHSISA